MRLILSLALVAPCVASAVPMALQHQGRALDAVGVPITGDRPITVELFSALEDETADWSWSGSSDFSDGYFSLHLTGGTPALSAALFDAPQLWIQLTVDSSVLPPQLLSSAAMALQADTATNLAGGTVVASSVRLTETFPVAGDCNVNTVGELRLFDDALQVCLAQGWRKLATTDLGTTSDNPGVDCAQIHQTNDGLPSGAYWIDPDGTGGQAAFQAYCDMETDGGGWTLIARDRLNDGSLVIHTELTWPTPRAGDPAATGDHILSNLQYVALESGSTSHEYLVRATGSRAVSGQFIRCTQDDPITHIGAPANGSCTYNDGSVEPRMANGIGMHSSANCQFIAFWTSTNSPTTWYQGSLFSNTPTSTCSSGWDSDFPHALGLNPFNAPHPQRSSDYTTWIFVK